MRTDFKSGVFSVSPTQELTGSLTLDGEDTILNVWGNQIENADAADGITITGVLENQKKVSLLNCIVTREQRFVWEEPVVHSYNFFPHYVVIGNRHYLPSDKTISTVSFAIDDAAALFFDRAAFGTVIVPPDRVSEVASMKLFEKTKFEENNRAVLAYWTGKKRIFSADTEIGRISANHQPKVDIGGGGLHGDSIRNRIVIRVEFSEAMSVKATDAAIRKLLRFFQTILGRPQNLSDLRITETATADWDSAELYLNMYPKHSRKSGVREPSYRDILVEGASEAGKLSNLLRAWLSREEFWSVARSLFAMGWSRGRSYDANRIVGAANMFDLLPDSAVPPDAELEKRLEVAVQRSREAFMELPQSEKRDSVLGYLGRLKRPSLKEKIRHRSNVISDRIGDAIPEIDCVTDAAVNLRNIYVHGGTPSGISKERLEDSGVFLTDTLEFVFCASDLIESGWDIESWHKKEKGVSHPFADYLRSYSDQLARFRE